MGGARTDGGEAGIGGPRWSTHRVDECVPVAVVAHADDRPCLLARAWKYSPRCAAIVVVALWAHRPRHERLFGQEVTDVRDGGFDLRDVAVKTMPRNLAAIHTKQARDGAQASDEVIGVNGRIARRRIAVVEVPQVTEPAEGLRGRPVADP